MTSPRILLLTLIVTAGCAAGAPEPCAPLWAGAIAGASLELVGAATTAQDVQDPTVRDTARVVTIGSGLGTVILISEAARCESQRE